MILDFAWKVRIIELAQLIKANTMVFERLKKRNNHVYDKIVQSKPYLV